MDDEKIQEEIARLKYKKTSINFEDMRIYENQLDRQFNNTEKKRSEFVKKFNDPDPRK